MVEAVVLGRATLAKIRQNLVWALGYNTIGIPIAGKLLTPFLELCALGSCMIGGEGIWYA